MGFFKSLAGPVVPDFGYAADGFMMVALARINRTDLDLHTFERDYAHQLLKQGCTEQQALSARWGGVHAISADVMMYDCAVKVAKDMAAEAGCSPEAIDNDRDVTKAIFLRAAEFMVRRVWEADRKEYGRFLKYIRAAG
jgi:hypothetical protein